MVFGSRNRDEVLLCDVDDEGQCRKWNEKRRERGEANYDDAIFEDLVRKFEKPDRRNRWDSPLFELWPHRDVKIPQPTIATQTCYSEANFLYELDKATQVTNAIVEAQSQALGGPLNVISLGKDLPTINMTRLVGLPELRRRWRTFIKLTGQTSLSGPPLPSDAHSAKRMSFDYLNRELGST